jgi:hypothetical protein
MLKYSIGIWSFCAAVLTPHWIYSHAVVATIGIGLGKDNYIECVNNGLDVTSRELFIAECKTFSSQVGLLKLLDKVE